MKTNERSTTATVRFSNNKGRAQVRIMDEIYCGRSGRTYDGPLSEADSQYWCEWDNVYDILAQKWLAADYDKLRQNGRPVTLDIDIAKLTPFGSCDYVLKE